MTGWLGSAYPVVLALHIIFVIYWMAGLFMMPRFFVYHQEAESGSAETARWVEREARLLRIILNPAQLVVWVLGLALAVHIGAFAQSWFLMKLVMVSGLSGYHGWMTGYARRLARGEQRVSGKVLRLLNEIPSLAVIVIVLLVVLKPF
jgi:protoporphyrinogen IX oxidase